MYHFCHVVKPINLLRATEEHSKSFPVLIFVSFPTCTLVPVSYHRVNYHKSPI